LACLVFYLFIERDGRNYGGSTSGLRWMFWMAPLWLVAMLPAVDFMSRRRWSLVAAVVLLALSPCRRATRRGTLGRIRGVLGVGD